MTPTSSIKIKSVSKARLSWKPDHLGNENIINAFSDWATVQVDFDGAWAIRKAQGHDELPDGRDFFLDVVLAMSDADDALDDQLALWKAHALRKALRRPGR